MIGQKKVLAIIPSRYESSRFPGKPLADILGKRMVQRVYEQVQRASCVDQVVVATDDERIMQHVASFGGKAVMTSSVHPSGTDRCQEALEKSGAFDVVVNIQGDEPFISPEQVDLVARCFEDETVELATQVKPMEDPSEHFESGMVFVALDNHNNALYFSRAVIPFVNDSERIQAQDRPLFHEHVGIYGYSASALKSITTLAPSRLERAESLEQLRWLENGFRVRCAVSSATSHCIDTPEDLDNVLKLIANGSVQLPD